MKRRLPALLAAVLLLQACSDDDGQSPEAGPGDAAVGQEVSVPGDGTRTDQTRPDLSGRDLPVLPPGLPGSICTQQNQTCAAGLKCVFLEVWNAPKGTCVRELKDGCQSWDDPRCSTTANYSVMCGPYSQNNVSTHICFLLCKLNNKVYDCPPAHTCKFLNGYDVCIPQ